MHGPAQRPKEKPAGASRRVHSSRSNALSRCELRNPQQREATADGLTKSDATKAIALSDDPRYQGTLMGWGSVMLDKQFRSDRAKLVRELADKADPWIRNRLLRLAGRYEGEERRAISLNTPANLQVVGGLGTGSERGTSD